MKYSTHVIVALFGAFCVLYGCGAFGSAMPKVAKVIEDLADEVCVESDTVDVCLKKCGEEHERRSQEAATE